MSAQYIECITDICYLAVILVFMKSDLNYRLVCLVLNAFCNGDITQVCYYITTQYLMILYISHRYVSIIHPNT